MNITQKTLFTIQKKGKGWVFSPVSFLKIRDYNTINPLLDRLENRGHFRSLGNGLYYDPVFDKDSGQFLPPTLNAIISALEIQAKDKFIHSNEYAAFLLGVIDSPPKEIKLLSGKNRNNKKIEVAGYKITIGKTSIPIPKNRFDKATLAFQTLKFVGMKNINSQVIAKVLCPLDEKEYAKLKKLALHFNWMVKLLNNN